MQQLWTGNYYKSRVERDKFVLKVSVVYLFIFYELTASCFAWRSRLEFFRI